MPKRKEPELDPKEQWKRFKEAAREHELSEQEGDIERAFKGLSDQKTSAPSRKTKIPQDR